MYLGGGWLSSGNKPRFSYVCIEMGIESPWQCKDTEVDSRRMCRWGVCRGILLDSTLLITKLPPWPQLTTVFRLLFRFSFSFSFAPFFFLLSFYWVNCTFEGASRWREGIRSRVASWKKLQRGWWPWHESRLKDIAGPTELRRHGACGRRDSFLARPHLGQYRHTAPASKVPYRTSLVNSFVFPVNPILLLLFSFFKYSLANRSHGMLVCNTNPATEQDPPGRRWSWRRDVCYSSACAKP